MIDQQHLRIERERRAEQHALPFVYGVNFTDCLRINGIATERLVDGRTIHAHRIYGAWKAYLRACGKLTREGVTTTTKTGRTREQPVVKEPVDLSEAEQLSQKMFTWMTTSYAGQSHLNFDSLKL